MWLLFMSISDQEFKLNSPPFYALNEFCIVTKVSSQQAEFFCLHVSKEKKKSKYYYYRFFFLNNN